MAVGYKFIEAPKGNIEELCRFETVQRIAGGANLEESGEGVLYPLTPLVIDKKNRTAKVCVRLRLAGPGIVEHLNGVKVGMTLSDGTESYTVGGIEEVEGGFKLDGVAGTAEDVLFEAEGTEQKDTPTDLLYATTPYKDNETITFVYRAFEIEEANLFAPLTDEDKEALGDRFYYI